MQYARLLLVVTLLVLVSTLTAPVAGSLNNPSPNPQASVSLHLALGNPSDATKDVRNEDNFLMVKPQFALSFNNSKGGPNWVSWHLQASDVERAKRLNRFHPDTDLPEGFKRVVTGVYTNSEFERGHLCNSEDRTKTQKDNHATFAMTNILPQKADNNKGPWVKLESFSRKLLVGNELYIVAGAFGTKGSIGATDRKVNIPRIFWKVVVVLPRGNNDKRGKPRAAQQRHEPGRAISMSLMQALSLAVVRARR